MKKITNSVLLLAILCCTVTIQAQSNCENDTNAPIAVCLAGLNVNVDEGETVNLWPTDFDSDSYDDCSAVSLSFSADASAETIEVNSNTASPMNVVVYVTDESGNQSSCWTYLIINNQVCTDDTELPVAICDETVVVTIDANSSTTIESNVLDDGSYDDCGGVTFSFSADGQTSTMTVDENTTSPTSVTLYVNDGNGNQNLCMSTLVVNVQDCSNDTQVPTPYCLTGVSVLLNEEGIATITTSDIDAGSFDNCSANVFLSFTDDVNEPERTITEAGEYSLQLWVMDTNGNQDFCETFISVLPFGSQLSISGHIRNEAGEGISATNVHAKLNNQVVATTTTDSQGAYTLTGLDNNTTYELEVEKDTDDLNGVSTFDLVIMRRHIVGLVPLDSPFKLIAADVNNSGTITTFDMLISRRLILGIIEEFDNVSSWRFVRSTIQFSDLSNPFGGGVTGNSMEISLETNNANGIDFIGIKAGDVNGTANVNP